MLLAELYLLNAAGKLLSHKQRLHDLPGFMPRMTSIVPGFPAAAVAASADYIGCMKTGPVIKSNKYRWFEPQHMLIGAEYFAHAWGEHEEAALLLPSVLRALWQQLVGRQVATCTGSPAGCCAQPTPHRCHLPLPAAGSIYALSGRVAADLAAMRDGALRHFANEGEGASVGSGGRRHSARSVLARKIVPEHDMLGERSTSSGSSAGSKRFASMPSHRTMPLPSVLSRRCHHWQLAAGLQRQPLR